MKLVPGVLCRIDCDDAQLLRNNKKKQTHQYQVNVVFCLLLKKGLYTAAFPNTKPHKANTLLHAPHVSREVN